MVSLVGTLYFGKCLLFVSHKYTHCVCLPNTYIIYILSLGKSMMIRLVQTFYEATYMNPSLTSWSKTQNIFILLTRSTKTTPKKMKDMIKQWSLSRTVTAISSYHPPPWTSLPFLLLREWLHLCSLSKYLPNMCRQCCQDLSDLSDFPHSFPARGGLSRYSCCVDQVTLSKEARNFSKDLLQTISHTLTHFNSDLTQENLLLSANSNSTPIHALYTYQDFWGFWDRPIN